jgi:hypothetical protein
MTQLSGGDDDLWARAQAEVDSTPPEPAHRRAARERYDRRLTRVTVVLGGTAVALLLLSPLVDPGDDASTWRLVTGLTVGVLGLLLAIGGTLARPFGSSPLASPLAWLSGRQRKELRRQVRAGDVVVPARLPLARLQARVMVGQHTDLLPQVDLMIVFVGLSIADDSGSRTVLTWLFVAAVGGAAFLQYRDARLARRFLAEHPAPDGT